MKHKAFKICITGGHLTPALAVIEAIRDGRPDWDIIFIGRERHGDAARHTSEEKRRITTLNIPFFPLTTGRFVRQSGFRMLWELVRASRAVIGSIKLMRKERPHAVLSFGGYIGVPVGIAARILSIPLFLHEQTMAPGFANRFLARFAKRILVSHEAVVHAFPKGKTVVTGLPIRRCIFDEGEEPNNLPKGPIVYVMGGVTGAASLNALVQADLPFLLKRYIVVHQTGREWEDDAVRVKSTLPIHIRDRYLPYPYLDDSPHSWMLGHAHIILARSGANTVWETMAKGVPAVFVPLPWSAAGEQQKNAALIAQEGAAIILNQRSAHRDWLRNGIDTMEASYGDFRNHALRLKGSVIKDAANQVVDVVYQYAAGKNP